MARHVKSCLKTVVIVLLPTEFEKPYIFTKGPYVMHGKLDKAYGPLLRAHTINSVAKSIFYVCTIILSGRRRGVFECPLTSPLYMYSVRCSILGKSRHC